MSPHPEPGTVGRLVSVERGSVPALSVAFVRSLRIAMRVFDVCASQSCFDRDLISQTLGNGNANRIGAGNRQPRYDRAFFGCRREGRAMLMYDALGRRQRRHR